MDIEHAFLQSNFFMVLQMMFLCSLMVPSAHIYGKAARTAASLVVTVGPVAILLYVLFQVSRLN